MKQKIILRKYQHKYPVEKRATIFSGFWYWRRSISWVVLVTFISFLLEPVFATFEPMVNEKEREDFTQRKSEAQNNTGVTKIRESAAKAIGLKEVKIKASNIKDSDIKRIGIKKAKALTDGMFLAKNNYQPYLEVGGVKYLNQHVNAAGVYDLFLPLLQTADQLLFTDLRIFDRSGSAFEGNAHLGFRKLYPANGQMVGVYAAFDRKRSNNKNWFNQITLGAEYWYGKWFIGGNFYKPLGKKQQLIDKKPVFAGRSLFVTKLYEKSMPGIDAELGYAFTDSFTGYVGGYYFRAGGLPPIAGPKVSFTYNYHKPYGRILGVLDGVSLEAGAMHDKPRGGTAYVGIKFKIGLTALDKNSNLFGLQRHMTELVRRDPDVVVEKIKIVEEIVIPVVPQVRSTSTDLVVVEKHKRKENENHFENLNEQDISTLTFDDAVDYKGWLTKQLGLSKDISKREVKIAHREFRFKNHPDKCYAGCDKKAAGILFARGEELFKKLEMVVSNLELKSDKGLFNNTKSSSPSSPTGKYQTPSPSYGADFADSSSKANANDGADDNHPDISQDSERDQQKLERDQKNKIALPVQSQTAAFINQKFPSAVFNNTSISNVKKEREKEPQFEQMPFLPSEAVVKETPAAQEASQQNSQKQSWIIAPIWWVDHIFNQFFDILIPIKPVRAADISIKSHYPFNNLTVLSKRVMDIDPYSAAPAPVNMCEICDNSVDAGLPGGGYPEPPRFNSIGNEPVYKAVFSDMPSKLRLAIQQQITDWVKAGDTNAKKNISTILFDKISDETAADLVPFFKSNLALQNKEFLKITAVAFDRLSKHQEISWSEEEKDLLPLFEVTDNHFHFLPLFIRKWMYGIHAYEVGNNEELLFNQKQEDWLQIQIAKIGWDVTKYFKKIKFSDIDELKQLVEFIKETYLTEGDLKKILNKHREPNSNGLSISTREIYTESLHGLLAKIKLPSAYKEKELKRIVQYLLETTDWSPDLLFRFISKGVEGKSGNNISKMTQVLGLIRDYRSKIKPTTTGRSEQTAATILRTKSFSNALTQIRNLIRDNSVFREKDFASLIEELIKLNPGNPDLKQFVERATAIINKATLIRKGVAQVRGITKPLSQWQGYDALCEMEIECEEENKKSKRKARACKKEKCEKYNDYIKYRKSIGNSIDINKIDDMDEAIAVISQVVFMVSGYYPRPAQLLGMLAQAEEGKWQVVKEEIRGWIAEIATGEGKSLINFMLAALKIMMGVPTVDILSSSYELAIRDAYDAKPLYDQLGISVDNNIQDAHDPYKSEVVYGDAASFIAGILREAGAGTRKERGFDFLIVDEEDSMFCDSNNMLVLLASSLPGGGEAFNQLFTYMHGTVRDIAAEVEDYQSRDNPGLTGCYLRRSLFNNITQIEEVAKFFPAFNFADDKNRNIDNVENDLRNIKLADTCLQFFEDYMRSYTKKLLNQPPGNRLVIMPNYLKEFAESQINTFVSSLLSSFVYKEKVDYVIKKPGGGGYKEQADSYTTLVIVDGPRMGLNTGTLLYGLLWGDGMHQFLQIREGLTIVPENLVSIFMSYPGYFFLYPKIVGSSGTIGDEEHQKFAKSVYGLNSIIIPRFTYRDLTRFPTIFARTKEEYLQSIINAIDENSCQRSRATMVMLDTIQEVEEYRDYFLELQKKDKESICSNARAISYSEGGKKEAEVIKEKLKPGDVIFTTAIGSRGTHFKNNAEVIENGGLYVIDASVAKNGRGIVQRNGRVARNGEPGSYQSIYYLEKLDTECAGKKRCLEKECNSREFQELEECLDQELAKRDKLKLTEDRIITVPSLKIKDELRSRFAEFRREANSPTGYKLVINHVDNGAQLEDLTLNLYQEEGKIKLKIVNKPGVTNIDITSLVSTINPDAKRKILAVLSSKDSRIAALSGLDCAIIQFIAGGLGYAKNPEIYNLIEYKISKLGSTEEGTEEQAKMFGGGKSGYLTWLLENDERYEDLYPEELASLPLEKVELRQAFFLWEEIAPLFTNGARDKQLVEDFGIFVKLYLEFPKYDTPSLNTKEGQEAAEKMVAQYKQKANDDFSTFIKDEIAKDQKSELVKNPAYGTSEARKLLWLYRDYYGLYYKSKYSSGRGIIFGGSSSSPIDTLRTGGVFRKHLEGTRTIENIKDCASSRLSFGSANYRMDNLLDVAIDYAEKVIKNDPDFIGIWAAYNIRAILETIKYSYLINGNQKEAENKVINNYVEYMQKAIGAIQTFNIGPLEAQLSFLQQHNLNPSSEAIQQLAFFIASYKEIVATFDENGQVAARAFSDQLGKLEVEQELNIETVAARVSVKEAVNQYLSVKGITEHEAWSIDDTIPAAGGFPSGPNPAANHRQMFIAQVEQYGGYLFKMQVTKLKEEEKDWWGTVGMFLSSVVSVCVGFALMAVPALAFFSSSLISQGVQDLISAGMSVFTGTPINFNEWMSAKGYSLAISAAVSGTLHLLQKISDLYDIKWLDTSKKMGDMASKRPVDWVLDPFKTAVTTRLGSTFIAKLGDKLLVDKEDIEAEASRAIDTVIQSSRKLLERLKATNRLPALYAEIDRIISGYKWRLSAAIETTSDIGAEVLDVYTGGLGRVISSTAHVVSNSMESARVIEEIAGKVKKTILHKEPYTLKTGEILEQVLVNSYQSVGGLLAGGLNAKNLEINVDYECTNLDNIELDKSLIRLKNQGEINVVGKCNEVKDLLASPDNFKSLRGTFINGVTRLKSHIQESSVHTGANLIAAELSKPTVALTDKAVGGLIDYIKEQRAQKRANPNQPNFKVPLIPELLKSETKVTKRKNQPKVQQDFKIQPQADAVDKSFASKCNELGICSFPTSPPISQPGIFNDYIVKPSSSGYSRPDVCPAPAYFEDLNMLDTLWKSNLNKYVEDNQWYGDCDLNGVCPTSRHGLENWWQKELFRGELPEIITNNQRSKVFEEAGYLSAKQLKWMEQYDNIPSIQKMNKKAELNGSPYKIVTNPEQVKGIKLGYTVKRSLSNPIKHDYNSKWLPFKWESKGYSEIPGLDKTILTHEGLWFPWVEGDPSKLGASILSYSNDNSVKYAGHDKLFSADMVEFRGSDDPKEVYVKESTGGALSGSPVGYVDVAFDANRMYEAVKHVTREWVNKRSYNLLWHNCRDFILQSAMKSYIWNGGKLYLIPTEYPDGVPGS